MTFFRRHGVEIVFGIFINVMAVDADDANTVRHVLIAEQFQLLGDVLSKANA